MGRRFLGTFRFLFLWFCIWFWLVTLRRFYLFVFIRSGSFFALIILEFRESFEFRNCAFIRQKLAVHVDFAEIDQLFTKRFPLANGAAQEPGNVPRIIGQIAALHVDQIKDHPVGAFQLERHPNGAFNEVARVCLVIRETVHSCASSFLAFERQ